MPFTVKLPNDEHMFDDTKLQKSTLLSEHGKLVVVVVLVVVP
jgi:hypothetical protein